MRLCRRERETHTQIHFRSLLIPNTLPFFDHLWDAKAKNSFPCDDLQPSSFFISIFSCCSLYFPAHAIISLARDLLSTFFFLLRYPIVGGWVGSSSSLSFFLECRPREPSPTHHSNVVVLVPEKSIVIFIVVIYRSLRYLSTWPRWQPTLCRPCQDDFTSQAAAAAAIATASAQWDGTFDRERTVRPEQR